MSCTRRKMIHWLYNKNVWKYKKKLLIFSYTYSPQLLVCTCYDHPPPSGSQSILHAIQCLVNPSHFGLPALPLLPGTENNGLESDSDCRVEDPEAWCSLKPRTQQSWWQYWQWKEALCLCRRTMILDQLVCLSLSMSECLKSLINAGSLMVLWLEKPRLSLVSSPYSTLMISLWTSVRDKQSPG